MHRRRIARRTLFPLSTRTPLEKTRFIDRFGMTMIIAGLMVMALLAFQSGPSVDVVSAADKVDICHATSSNSNPYVQNSPNASGDVQGHDGHDGPVWTPGASNWGDIIPPFDYDGGSYPGKNWTPAGQAIYNNGCKIPAGTFRVTKDCSPNVANCAATIAVTCTSPASVAQVVNSQATEPLAGSPVQAVFAIKDILPSTTCTATESNVTPNTYSQTGSCNATLNEANGYIASCTITNTPIPLPSGTFTVSKACSPAPAPQSQCTASVTVDCTNGATDNGSSQTATMGGSNAVFTISNISTSTVCTATESSATPAGYTQNLSCSSGTMNSGNSYSGSCTITNTRVDGTFTVNKVCSPATPTQSDCNVQVTVQCTNASEPAGAETATHGGAAAVFEITGISGSSTCTATESGGPAGYTTGLTCNGVLNSGNQYDGGCTITNTPTTAPTITVTVLKDCVPNVADCSATVTLTCGAGPDVSAAAVAIDNNGSQTAASFTVTGATSGVTDCTASESNVSPVYYESNNSCNVTNITTAGPNTCTITNDILPADVTAEKTASTNSISPDGVITYTITVTNDGDGPSANVVVTDDLPNAWTSVSANWDGNPCSPIGAGNVVTCQVGSIPANSDVTVSITATVAGCDDFTNTASVTVGTQQPLTPSAPQTVVNCSPSVNITKNGTQSINSGGDVTYTLFVQNNGNDAANNVVVTDNLPDAWTIVSAVWNDGTDHNCTIADGAGATDVTCNIPSIAANGGSVTVQIVATTTGCDPFQNTAAVTFTGLQTPITSNPITTTVNCAADVDLTKAGTTQVDSLGNVSYSITVTNTGTADATNVMVLDNLPDNWTAVAGSWPVANACNVDAANQVACTIGTMTPGQSIVVTITATTAGCNDHTNIATVTYGPQNESVTDSSNEVITTVLCETDVSLTKAGTATVTSGGVVTYTLTVTNTGTADAENVIVEDDLPNGWSGVDGEWDPGDNDCAVTPGTNVVTCNLATLSSQETVTITITAIATGCIDFENVATVTYGPAGDRVSDDSNPVTTVVLCPDIGVEKTHAAGDFVLDPGEVFEWFVTITVADGPATGVVVDALPSGFILNSINDGNVPGLGCSENPANVLNCQLTAVADGSYQVVLSVQAPDGNPEAECGSQTNTVNVTQGGGAASGNDSASDDVFILCVDAEEEEPPATPTPTPTATATPGNDSGDPGDNTPPTTNDVLGTQATPPATSTPRATSTPSRTATPAATSEVLGVRALPATGTGSEQGPDSAANGWIFGGLIVALGAGLILSSRLARRQ